MGKEQQNSDDWQCCEQCAYCFTIFVGIIFFLAGLAMAVLAALLLWGNIDLNLDFLPLQVDSISVGIFVVGLCIAGTALLGMISAGCARCAANPDGVNDCCEKCCTAVLSFLYIIILSLLLAASIVIAGFLTYYAVQIGTEDSCTATNFNRTSEAPDALACPIDTAMWEIFFNNATSNDNDDAWETAQTATYTCGYYCNGNTCTAADNTAFPGQITGAYCFTDIPDAAEPITTWTDGRTWATVQGSPSTQALRPTVFEVLNTYLIPLLAVWWCIVVLAILLIVAACAMCIRKAKTKKESTYKPNA